MTTQFNEFRLSSKQQREAKRKMPKMISAAIVAALDDLAAAERSSKYVIDMGTWHSTDADQGACSVCFAGALMAGTLEMPAEQSLIPGDFGLETAKALCALNSVRGGLVIQALTLWPWGAKARALKALTAKYNDQPVPVPRYFENKRGFKLALRKIARELAELGV